MKNEKLTTRFAGIIQFIKFGIVGVGNTAVDWVVFYVLINTILQGSHTVSKVISFVVALINSYVWNTIWTFKKEYKKAGDNAGQRTAIFVKFVIVGLIGWGINVYAFSLASKDLTTMIFNRDLLPLVLASAAAIIWNFFANKLWTYKK